MRLQSGNLLESPKRNAVEHRFRLLARILKESGEVSRTSRIFWDFRENAIHESSKVCEQIKKMEFIGEEGEAKRRSLIVPFRLKPRVLIQGVRLESLSHHLTARDFR